jgi:hypothetical protein
MRALQRDTLLLACAAIIVVILATTVVSRWWSLMYRGTTPSRSTWIDIERGAVSISLASDGTSQFTTEPGSWTLVRRNPDIASPESRGFVMAPSVYRNPFVFQVVMPFWLLIVPLLMVAGWRLHRLRKRSSERCPSCGYSVRGLQENVCPECGVFVHVAVHQKPQDTSS